VASFLHTRLGPDPADSQPHRTVRAVRTDRNRRIMAISDVAEYAHLSESDLADFAAALDDIRRDVEEGRGSRDRAYIRRTIAFQRCLELVSRLTIAASKGRRGWIAGTVGLAAAKSIENMELAHNIGHGQWDWMNDPEIHSATWEWDMAGLSSQWRYSHNYRHHVNTNVVGVDDDLGYGVLRVTPDQEWNPSYLLAPLRSLLLAVGFEWGIALHDLYSERERRTTDAEKSADATALLHKIGRQTAKDYVLYPVLSRRRWRRTLRANVVANVLRNVWAYVVISCGHFADGAEKFTPETLVNETRPEWYLRQMLGSANFHAGSVMAFMSGNLCYQIEHHLFPDLPSNHYAAIARRVRPLCAKYGLPYTTGPLLKQYLLTVRTVFKLALPDRPEVLPANDVREPALTAPEVSAGTSRILTSAASAPGGPAARHR
jgi:NADPH-dependent stearoyl-CoA 9-desaturase